jgi:hypothetical protein
MEHPWTGIICHESDGYIVSYKASLYDVAPYRVDIVSGVASGGTHNPERML